MKSPVAQALAQCKSGLLAASLVSLMMNLLMLTGPFYMLQIYDRVLPAHSMATLVAISLLALLLFAAFGFLDLVRTRLMSRVAEILDLKLADAAFDGQTQSANGARREALRDLGIVRQFLAGPAATGLMDIPWLPIYVGIVFALHPLIGWIAIASSILFVVIAAMNEARGRLLSRSTDAVRQREDRLVADVHTNVDSVRAMGMTDNLKSLWHGAHVELVRSSGTASDRNANYASLSKTLRLILQSAILGVGAYLVVQNELSGGALIAASIIFARALAPIDQAVAQWRSILSARQSWARLQGLECNDAGTRATTLPAPARAVDVHGLSVGTCDQRILVQGLSLSLAAGDAVGVIGPSGIGKTSFLRTLVGAQPPAAGEIRLDGASPDQWSEGARGAHVGYLAQDVQLLDGTIAQNIARFGNETNSDRVIQAARQAGVHDFILSLPAGYDTVIGGQGLRLSCGQRQRIGLARAIFGQPFLIVLDEPNAHLDAHGEATLCAAIRGMRALGRVVVVAAHRTSVLAELNKLLVLQNGQPAVFGDRDEVLARIAPRQPQPERGLHVVNA